MHFTLGPAQFAIGRYDPVPAAAARFNSEVDDVNAWWARLEPEVDLLEPLTDTRTAPARFTIPDPDGNELGFVSPRRCTPRH